MAGNNKQLGIAYPGGMQPGFNHNLRHRDVVFHVQTEDGGRSDPKVVTQLFIGGRCLDVDRWAYREALDLDAEALDTIVRTRMVEMHKAMMRRVTKGCFNAAVFGRPPKAPAPGRPGDASGAPRSAPRSTPATEAPTIEAPVEALEERPPMPASAPPSAGTRPEPFTSPPPRKPSFAASTLSDDELLAEIDAELRRRSSSVPRRAPSRGDVPESAPPASVPPGAPSQARARRFPSDPRTLVEPPAVMQERVRQAQAAAWPDDEATTRDELAAPSGPKSAPISSEAPTLRPSPAPDRSAAARRASETQTSDPWGDPSARSTPDRASPTGSNHERVPSSGRRRAFSGPDARPLRTTEADEASMDLPAPAEPPDAPTLEDVILDYLSSD